MSGRRLDFTKANPEDRTDVRALGALRFEIPRANGRRRVIDLTDLPNTEIVRDMAAFLYDGFMEQSAVGQPDYRELTVVRDFLRHLGDGVHTRRLEDLTPDDIDGFEQALRQEAPRSAHPKLRDFLQALKRAEPHRLSEAIWTRLQITSLSERRPVAVHIEPYSDSVVRQIKKACVRRVYDTNKRLTTDAAELLAAGRDPRGGSSKDWRRFENLVWLVNEVGPISRPELVALSGVDFGWHMRSIPGGLTGVQRALYPSPEDLYPFFLLLLVLTGMPPASALNLRTDCLSNERAHEGRRRISVSYTKARAGQKRITQSYYDEHITTVGGLIRAILTITSRLRRHGPFDHLFICGSHQGKRGPDDRVVFNPGYRSGGGVDPAVGVALPLQFAREISLTDEDGQEVFGIQHRRLRKHRKRKRYIAVEGRLPEFADDHTLETAKRPYAMTEANRPLHERAVADGIADALVASERATARVRSTTLTAEAEATMAAAPEEAAERLRIPLPVVKQLASGELDMFIAACTGFTTSPFAPAGQPCRGAPFGWCVDCPNAVIPERKLPQVIAFLAHVETQRKHMTGAEWRAVWGKAHAKIVGGVLPQFSEGAIAAARSVAAGGSATPYMAPELGEH
jgi:hypothetical protein